MIKNLFDNWKTTSAGLAAITGSVVHLVFAVIHKTADESTWTTSVLGIFTGIGLLAAGDASKSKQDAQNLAQNAAKAIETGNTDLLKQAKDQSDQLNQKP